MTERKNVLGLARAFETRGEGTLTFLGDGPLRPALEGRRGIRVVGRVAHADVPTWIAACDVLCQPSLVEPFGLATLEASIWKLGQPRKSINRPTAKVLPVPGGPWRIIADGNSMPRAL